MNQTATAARFESRLTNARQLAATNQVLQAEMIYFSVLKEWPECIEAAANLARFAMDRGDAARAVELLERTRSTEPDNPHLANHLALAYAASGRIAAARTLLEQTVARSPDFHPAWLLLGQVRESLGDTLAANRAWFQAIQQAQKKGLWLDEKTTPPRMLQQVLYAMEKTRSGRREFLFASFENLRQQHGSALKRVERALTGYLREWDATPSDSRQRPKFLFFPDIPNAPYHDPLLQPWAKKLLAAYPEIRAEALQLLNEDQVFQPFLQFKEGDPVEDYLSGDGPKRAWDAFFFYRHGKRYDDNHARCPQTSAMLESIELCRIPDQAPEICFSILTPGSHIMPHYGVTNTRLVMHLPLIVPADCALNIVDAGEHHWREGELMMFDDTFQHEAWNRSDQTRVILLMDCWNPYLTEVEKLAIKQLIEAITEFDRAA